MSRSPRTGVVIPTFNRGAMAVQAARSALAQDVPVRVVVVDDGSTDDTQARVDELRLEVGGERLTLVSQANAERGAARNRGAEECRDCDFLLFLDADDALEPDHVRSLEALADTAPGALLAASAGALCDEHLTPYAVITGPPGTVTLEGFLRGSHPLPPTLTLVRAEPFRQAGGFDPDRGLAGSEDWLLHARLLLLGDGVRHGRATARVRRHEGNTMADPDRMLATMLLAHHRLFGPGPGDAAAPSVAPAAPGSLRDPSLARLVLQASTQFYAVGRGADARRQLRRAARVFPAIVFTPLWGWTWLRSLLPHRAMVALRRRKQHAGERRLGAGCPAAGGSDEGGAPTLGAFGEPASRHPAPRCGVPVSACPVCRADGPHPPEHVLPDRLYGVPGLFAYDRCRGCRSVFQNPRVLGEDLPLLYPTSYYTHAGGAAHGPAPGDRGWRGWLRRGIQDAVTGAPLPPMVGWLPALLARSRALRERAFWGLPDGTLPRRRSPGRALEIGPGSGWELGLLARAGWAAEGFEFDPAAATVAAGQSRCRVHSGHFLDSGDELGSYDLIYLSHVLEHLPTPRDALAWMVQRLAPGGRIVVVIPNPDSSAAHDHGTCWVGWDPPRHLVLPTVEGLHRMAEEWALDLEVQDRYRNEAPQLAITQALTRNQKRATSRGLTGPGRLLAAMRKVFIAGKGNETHAVLTRRP